MVTEGLIQLALKELEQRYEQRKAEEVGLVHNGFVEVLNNLKPSFQNALLALELTKLELMEQSLGRLQGMIVKEEVMPDAPDISGEQELE